MLFLRCEMMCCCPFLCTTEKQWNSELKEASIPLWANLTFYRLKELYSFYILNRRQRGMVIWSYDQVFEIF